MPAEQPYGSAEFVVQSLGRSWSFLRPADPDAVLDSLTEDEYARDQFLPYWAELWPATSVLLRRLETVLPPRAGTACDLGCGLGVVGTILAARGHDTLAVDIAPAACRYASVNMRRYAPGRARVVCGDWRHPFLRARFDLIAAADVLYEPRWVAPVLSFVQAHLAPGGTACIADPKRASWHPFLSEARRRGFDVERVVESPLRGGGSVEICRMRRTW